MAEVFDADFMGIHAVASLLVMAVGVFVVSPRPRDVANRAGICIMGSACSNSGYMAFPILLLAYLIGAQGVGDEPDGGKSADEFPVALTLIAIGRGKGARVGVMIWGIVRDLLRRPLILALIAGLAWWF